MDDYFKVIGLKSDYRSFLVPCEICGNKEFIIIQEKGRIGGPGVYGELPVKGCVVCGYIMINPRYEERFYIDYYHKVYQQVATGSTRPTDAYIQRQK